MVEAKYYSKLNESYLFCELCPKRCKIHDKGTGLCRAFINIDGKLYNKLFGKASSIALDPIEKKPLFHFYPGSQILSVGGIGCNLRCQFCQNWHLIEGISSIEEVTSEDLLRLSIKYESIGVAFTYNEPIINFEFIMDTFKVFKNNNLKTVLVTNGYINEEPLKEILKFTDALNIDLKSIDDSFYNNICMGKINPVKNTISLANEKSFIEITNLVIPELNDSDENFHHLCDFITSINDHIPLHFSKYYPCYKLNNQPTPESTLIRAYNIAKEKLKYVYIGNIHIKGKEDSLCPYCGNVLVKRDGYFSKVSGIKNKNCSLCHKKVNFII